MVDNRDEHMFEMLFVQMIMSLNEAAMIQMGKVVDPQTGQTEKSLDQARGTIDLLRTLQKKTDGNLNKQEKQVLDQSLVNLQMNFVYEQEAAVKQKAVAPEEAGEKTRDSEPAQKDEAGKDDNDDDSSLGKRPGMDN